MSRISCSSNSAAEISDFCRVTDLNALRSLAVKSLNAAPGGAADLSTMALIAGRACLFICAEMDSVLDSGKDLGAFHDASIYSRCVQDRYTVPPADVEAGLVHLADTAAHVAKYLAEIDMLDGFIDLIAELLEVEAIETESEDLFLHRCLHAWYAFSETHLKSLLARLNPTEHIDGRDSGGYEKGDANKAVLDSARGPILGHHHYLSPLVATCSDSAMDLRTALLSYADSIITYMPDWESLPREQGMAAAIISAIGAPVERERKNPARVNDPEWTWLRRNALGTKTLKWFAKIDATAGIADNASLLHTGIFCDLPGTVRKVAMLCLGYGQFGLWPVPRLLSLADYGLYGCAALGEMMRGWTSDHDAEASIGEHSPLNWLCVECAEEASRACMLRYNALGARSEWETRIAWAPQTFNFMGGRHQGLRRRTDNIRARITPPEAPVVRQISHSYTPIRAGDHLAAVVDKLLALIGLAAEPGLIDRLGIDEWDIEFRICPECDFPGSREQLFMLAVGCTRIGALLPQHYMEAWTALVEKYAYRLLPALQVRLLTPCGCAPYWIADVLSSGYEDAGTSCGLSSCLATKMPMPPTVRWDHPIEDERYSGVLLSQQLLDQATVEAHHYAAKSGRTDWLALVTRPLSSL
jgi:hypothetical protein